MSRMREPESADQFLNLCSHIRSSSPPAIHTAIKHLRQGKVTIITLPEQNSPTAPLQSSLQGRWCCGCLGWLSPLKLPQLNWSIDQFGKLWTKAQLPDSDKGCSGWHPLSLADGDGSSQHTGEGPNGAKYPKEAEHDALIPFKSVKKLQCSLQKLINYCQLLISPWSKQKQVVATRENELGLIYH